MLRDLLSYDNPIFDEVSNRRNSYAAVDLLTSTDLDEDSFRSELERDSAHSSIAKMQQQSTTALSHEQKHEMLLREADRKASLQGMAETVVLRRQSEVDPEQIEVAVEDVPHRHGSRRRSSGGSSGITAASAIRSGTRRPHKRRSLPLVPLPPPPPTKVKKQPLREVRPEKPAAANLSNLFGLVDSRKLQRAMGGGGQGSNAGWQQQQQGGPYIVKESPNLSAEQEHKLLLLRSERARGRNDELFFGSICAFVAGLLLIMSYASPYWLVSWENTQSPFHNMGLWEFCFYRFHHPDYQFDHLFHGCHALYGDEYRLIREKLLPGWLMVVQLFVTLAVIFSFVGQMVLVGLILRYPLEIILRFEHHFCGLTFACNAFSAILLFMSICIFGSCCWDRSWLLYPNFNYVSWSYAFAVFSCLIHLFAAALMYKDAKNAKERKERNKALIMQMHPPGFSTGSGYHMGGSGYI